MLLLLAAAVYVGNSVCGDCHRNLTRSYLATAMSRVATCERCHGPGSQHAQGSARMVVPSALDPGPRDSVCAQCHLHGAVQIERAGKTARQYRPGEDFAKYVATFVADPPGEPAGHVESLAASRCRQSSPELWCGTCHDVHDATINRNACLQCHATRSCGRGPDCVTCHMPAREGAVVRTDHSIPARARSPQPATPIEKLRPFTAADAGSRELRLAYTRLRQKAK